MLTDNKQIIQQALAELIRTGDPAALAPMLHADFVHHRPDANRNRTQWLQAVREVPLAALRVQVHHMLAEGPYVVMHSKRWLEGSAQEITGVDIWRFDENGLITEAWEILEPPDNAASNMRWYAGLSRL